MTAVEVHGEVVDGFEPVVDAFAVNLLERGEVGAAYCAYLDGEPVVDIWGGVADRDTATPWSQDTIVIVYSCTKGVTAVAANQLIERGLLDPDAPVATYWPEFAAAGKGEIPVRWVLSHRAGLAAIDAELTMEDVAAWDPVIDAIAAQTPNWEPGTKHGYHARTYGWMVGELIRRVSGLMPGEYVAREISTPLGLDFTIGLPASEDARVAPILPAPQADPEVARLIEQVLSDRSTLLGRVMGGPSDLFRYDDRWNSRLLRGAQMPSSNGHSDARSLARMYAACMGEVDGVRLLSDGSLASATEIQSSGKDCVIGQPLSFGLGFALPPTLGPSAGRAAFGHSGAGGAIAFCDPDRGLACSYVMNQMQLSMSELDARGEGLIAATYAALGVASSRGPLARE